MNEDYKSIEPRTDLGLGLGYTDQYVQGRLTNKSGVGANAGSLVDVKYVTTDSLSEIVWSPHKGLSLRCADSNFKNRKSSTLWDAGANNSSFALPRSITAEKSTSNNLLDNRTIILSQAESHLKNVSGGKTSNKTSSGGAACMTSEVKMHALEKGVGNYANETNSRVEVSVVCFKQEDLQATGGVDLIDAGNIPLSTIGKNNCSSLPVDVNRINEVSTKQDEPELDKVQHEFLVMDSIGGDINEYSRNISAGKVVLHPLNVCEPSVSHPTIFGKLESSAENDLQNMNDKAAGCEGSKIIVTDSSHEVLGSNEQDEKNNCKDTGDSASPTNCRMHWKQRKGKEKALSDGDVHGRMSNNEDNSYGSVESCSSAFLSTSKRRWSFEEQLIVGNKRVKKQDDYTPGSTSNFGQDSSFMNWISNMMKGFSVPIQDEGLSLDLTLAKPDVEHGCLNEEPMYKKSSDLEFSGIGFQSIFRSLYNPITRGEEGAPNENCQAEQEAKEIEVIKKSSDVNAAPIACFGESENFGKQLLLNNETATELISGNEATPLVQLKNSPEISCGSHQSHKTWSQELRNSFDLIIGAKTGEVMHSSSLGKCKSNSTENVDCDLPSVRTNYITANTSDHLKNLWITRLAAKTSGFMLNPETCNQNTKDDSQCSMHSARLIPCPQNHIDHHSMDDLDTAVSKEQCYTANTEASPGHKEFKSHNEQKSISKFKSILRTPRLRSSEAMASVFARRLGAFKHIISSDLIENAGHETVTCFFCGTRGHHLQDCSEITEKEVEDLSRNIRLCKEADEFPCLCLRCFQLNHWAIACPLAASRCQQQSEFHASLADLHDTGEIQPISGIGLNTKPQLVENRIMEGVASMLDDTDDPNFKTDLRPDCKVTDKVKSAAMSIPKCVIPRFSEKSLKESEMVHVDSFLDKQNSDIPQVVFNAVKKLRLSRSNILKCMNSHMSLSHLDGFFLRIRLGKWEEGVGGTGYHVACIRGAQLAKNSISVIVRGVKCQVQSQYISNHDFLEDELREWWCAASKDGSKILPLAADLRAKVEKKKELDF